MKVRVISFSGAHATGKTTLIADLRERLKDSSQGVIAVPSASTLYAQQLSKELGQELSYKEINDLGLRQRTQYQLPSYMSALIRQAVGAAFATLITQPATRTVEAVNVLVDRWFSDIAVYNVQEGIEDPRILKEPLDCFLQFQKLMEQACMFLDIEHSFYHIKTTVEGSEGFEVDESKFRANTDPREWETIFNVIWNYYTIGETAVISSGGRDERVSQCLSLIER